MVADIPAMTFEIRREESVSFSSRRWLWSPWTWQSGLAILIGLFALLETRIHGRSQTAGSVFDISP